MSIILEQIVVGWQTVIARANERKQQKFGDQADDAMLFYTSPDHGFMYTQAYMQNSLGLSLGSDAGDLPKTRFKATVNLTANAVSVFLPVLYNRNPTRTVKAKQNSLDDTLITQLYTQLGLGMYNPVSRQEREYQRLGRIALFQQYLNATPRELDLKGSARLSVLEAFVKGMGILWAETFPTLDGTRLVGLAHDSIDYFNIDPDAENLKDAGFITRKRIEPIYKVEKKFGLPAGTLRDYGNVMSSQTMSSSLEDDFADEPSETCDTITYYEVYSRIGMGSNLKSSQVDSDLTELSRDVLGVFGDNVYLAIPAAGGYPYPLNVRPDLFNAASGEDLAEEQASGMLKEITESVEWPVPAYCDRSNPWPCVVLGFHPVPKTPWCHSHMTPAMGIQKAIDWIMSFLIGRVQITSRAFMVVPKSLDEGIKDQILYGRDLELLEIEAKHPGTQQMLCDFLKMPEVNGEIWKLLMALKQEHEDATGVTELNMAGRTSTQMRSAAEAGLKRDILSVRPDDMANAVEDWLAAGARLEAAAAATIMRENDVARAFNEPKPAAIAAAAMELTGGVMPPDMPTSGPCTGLWMKLVYGMPVDQLFSELEFTIESGSARRPNQEDDANTVDQTAQLLLQSMLQLYSTTGNPSQVNTFVTDFLKSRNKANFQGYMFPDMAQQVQANQQQQAMQQMAEQAAAAQGGAAGGKPSNGSPKPLDGGGRGGPIPNELVMQMLMAAQGGMPGGSPDGLPPPMPMTNGVH